MEDDKKLTLALNADSHARATEIANELGITVSDLLRRSLGLVSIVHGLMEESSGDLYVCSKDDEGNFAQQHVISDIMY